MTHAMISFDEWKATSPLPARPWLLVGKGPTFAHRGEVDLGAANVMSLNHVVAEMPVDVAHIIDLDVVEACADRLADNCRWLLMPRVPHIQTRSSLCLLDDFVPLVRVLRRLADEGRLVWYNLNEDRPFAGAPTVPVRYFSSEAALTLIGELGGRSVRTLGVDGGQSYSGTFEGLAGATRLVNSQPSFDLQFPELERISRKYGIDYRPVVEPVRVFVGTEENQLPAARVLEHSIRSNTKLPVRVEFMQYDGPIPRSRANRPRTAFSFCRFEIPERCGYRGRAIYLDADMQVFGDIEELWTRPFDGHSVMITRQDTVPDAWKDSSWFHPGRQMSVMVLDCSQLDWEIGRIVGGLDEGRFTYRDLMFDLCVVDAEKIDDTLPPEWNHLERFDHARTRLVHYTVVPTQPWKNDENPLRAVWEAGYRDAVAAGAIVPDEVTALAKAGGVKPFLASELSALPVRRFPVSAPVELELAAAYAHIDRLEARTVKGRTRTAIRRLRPLSDVIRANAGRGGVHAALDRLAARARAQLR